MIGYEQERLYIYCGNKVFNRDVAKLKEKIEEIRWLDKDALNALYKARRKMERRKGVKEQDLA